MLVTVFTPTYNRAYRLTALYESLLRQTSKDFEWLIVDDGSTDNTEELVKPWLEEESFPVRYYKKKNGGKHTAMNYSHPYINGELLFIVDSDDTLTVDSIETIDNDWRKYKGDVSIGVLSYLLESNEGLVISQGNAPEYYVDDDINYRVNHNVIGDRCEIMRTDVFKQFKMPEFPGERFMGEGWLWRNIALQYKTVYIRKSIYIAEYLGDGLSKSGRLFRMNNPLGMMENCKSFFIPQVRTKVQFKQMLAFGTYGFCAGLSCMDIVKRSGKGLGELLMLPFSYMLYRHWCRVNGFKRE